MDIPRWPETDRFSPSIPSRGMTFLYSALHACRMHAMRLNDDTCHLREALSTGHISCAFLASDLLCDKKTMVAICTLISSHMRDAGQNLSAGRERRRLSSNTQCWRHRIFSFSRIFSLFRSIVNIPNHLVNCAMGRRGGFGCLPGTGR